MATAVDQPGPANPPRLPLIPAGFDWVVFAALALGLAVLYGPAYNELAHTLWASDEQGHGPIILAVATWLLYGKRHELAAVPSQPLGWLGWPIWNMMMSCDRPSAYSTIANTSIGQPSQPRGWLGTAARS